MAIMIPEALASASEPERVTFDLLRRSLPASCAVWHASALEVEDAQRVPFVMLSEDTGISLITPLGWHLGDTPRSLASFWQRSSALQLEPEQEAELDRCQERAGALLQLLLDSRLPSLVDPQGKLRPALHPVYLLTRYKGREVNRLNLRNLAPDALVLAADEVDQLYAVLSQQTPPGAQLTSEAFDTVRAILSPGVEIRLPRRSPHPEAVAGEFQAAPSVGSGLSSILLDLRQEQAMKSFADIPADQQATARDLDARLIRGVVGSGKSLILVHRARFLCQLYPDWQILILTYNRALADFLRKRMADLPGPAGDVEIIHFHAWCRRYLVDAGLWRNDVLRDRDRRDLVENLLAGSKRTGILADANYLLEELDWIRDQGFTQWHEYVQAQRHGRGRGLIESQRREAWNLLQRYRAQLQRSGRADWAEVAPMMLEGMADGRIPGQRYHAILVDEAQDFAASWFAVVQGMLKESPNMLFIASDAAQKLYRRSLSWRALGIDVTGGRSRVLNRSYRNTYEILRVAYELVRDDADLRAELQSQGDDIIAPEMDAARMRRGPVPLILQLADPKREMEHVVNHIHELREAGFGWEEIAVLHKDNQSLRTIQGFLSSQGVPTQLVRGSNIDLVSPDVKLLTLHSSKGLEFTAVFVPGVDRLQPRPGLTGEELAQEIAEERRLLYVGLTRAREFLFITHTGSLPLWATAALAMAESEPMSRATRPAPQAIDFPDDEIPF